VLPNHSIHKSVDSDNHIITFASKKLFGLADIGQRGTDMDIAVGRREEALVIVIFLRTSSCHHGIEVILFDGSVIQS
jgi:hypothetical protein